MGSKRTGDGFDRLNFKYPKVRTPPLREPFHSLFQSSPREALRLLRKLCNHAITAWCQLHRRFEFTGLRHRVSIFWDSPLESLRNLRSNPSVRVTRDGTVVSGRAEIVEDAVRKRAIVTVHPFVPLAPFRIVHTLALDVFAPVTIGMLRRWVIASGRQMFFPQGRWVDFIDASAPIPGTSRLVVAGSLASPSAIDPQQATYWAQVSP